MQWFLEKYLFIGFLFNFYIFLLEYYKYEIKIYIILSFVTV